MAFGIPMANRAAFISSPLPPGFAHHHLNERTRRKQSFSSAKAFSILGIDDELAAPAVPPKAIHPQSTSKRQGTDSPEFLTPSSTKNLSKALVHVQNEHPLKDSSKAAWIFLFGACIVEAVSWSFPACFGVFREYYFTHPPFEGVTVLAVVGVMSDGCLQMLMPFLLGFLKRFPKLTKRMMWLGLWLCVVASLGAALSTKPWQLIATQGVLYGTGAGFLTAPVIVFMAEWFDKRQSFAYGLMFGASGLFGSFLPTVYTRLLHRYGQKITLLSHGAGVLLLTTGALLCIDHRVPLEKEVKRHVAVPTNVEFLKKGSFYFLGVSVFVQALVLNLPAIYLPSFAVDIGSSHTTGAIALSMFNLATASGQVSFGLFADHKNSFYSTLFLSTIISGLSAILLWSEAKTLTATIIFAVLYGASSGGYGILRSRFAMEVTGKEDKEQMLMVLGLFTATRGAGNVAGGFFGERLVDENVPVSLTAYGLDKFTPLVVFVGLSMLLAGLLGAMQYLNRGYRNNRESSKVRNLQRHTKERMSGDTV